MSCLSAQFFWSVPVFATALQVELALEQSKRHAELAAGFFGLPELPAPLPPPLATPLPPLLQAKSTRHATDPSNWRIFIALPVCGLGLPSRARVDFQSALLKQKAHRSKMRCIPARTFPQIKKTDSSVWRRRSRANWVI
jgi:hypothetical protein